MALDAPNPPQREVAIKWVGYVIIQWLLGVYAWRIDMMIVVFKF